MDPTPDELAGVVDLFGALTREEIHGAIENLAARTNGSYDHDTLEERIAAAVDSHALVRVDEDLFAPGPAAFPTLPEHGSDLPHMMEVPEREVDRERLAETVREELEGEVDAALDADEQERIDELLDLCYEVEAWASVDLSETRARLSGALDG